MRLLLFIGTPVLFALIIIIYFTIENDLPEDGAAFLGFPQPFMIVYYDEATGKFVKSWNYSGFIMNIFLFILIYLGLLLLRKNVFNKKANKVG